MTENLYHHRRATSHALILHLNLLCARSLLSPMARSLSRSPPTDDASASVLFVCWLYLGRILHYLGLRYMHETSNVDFRPLARRLRTVLLCREAYAPTV